MFPYNISQPKPIYFNLPIILYIEDKNYQNNPIILDNYSCQNLIYHTLISNRKTIHKCNNYNFNNVHFYQIKYNNELKFKIFEGIPTTCYIILNIEINIDLD